MGEKIINEILELVRLNEYFSMKSNSLLKHIQKGGDVEYLVREEKRYRKIAIEAHNEAVEKIKETDTFYAMFRLLDKSIESKNVDKESKIRSLLKKKFDAKAVL